jgi:hypothetical protein
MARIDDLIRQMAPDDPRLSEALVSEYYNFVYHLGCSILGDPGEADDAAQETFIQALRSLGSYQPGTNCKGWLARIAVNTCRTASASPNPAALARRPASALADPAARRGYARASRRGGRAQPRPAPGGGSPARAAPPAGAAALRARHERARDRRGIGRARRHHLLAPASRPPPAPPAFISIPVRKHADRGGGTMNEHSKAQSLIQSGGKSRRKSAAGCARTWRPAPTAAPMPPCKKSFSRSCRWYMPLPRCQKRGV